jgi:hypothetical protein
MTQRHAMNMMSIAIMGVVNEWRSGCTFAHLERSVPNFRGELNFIADDGITIWEGLSETAVAAIRDLLARGAIHFERTSFESYQLDGRVLKLRIAKQTPAPPGVFCWRPSAVCIGPGPGGRQQGGK